MKGELNGYGEGRSRQGLGAKINIPERGGVLLPADNALESLNDVSLDDKCQSCDINICNGRG